MLDDKLLARLPQGFRIKVVKPGVCTYLRGPVVCCPVSITGPNDAGLFWIFVKAGLACAYPNVGFP